MKTGGTNELKIFDATLIIQFKKGDEWTPKVRGKKGLKDGQNSALHTASPLASLAPRVKNEWPVFHRITMIEKEES